MYIVLMYIVLKTNGIFLSECNENAVISSEQINCYRFDYPQFKFYYFHKHISREIYNIQNILH